MWYKEGVGVTLFWGPAYSPFAPFFCGFPFGGKNLQCHLLGHGQLGITATGHVKKLDTLFFLNISKNDYPSQLLSS